MTVVSSGSTITFAGDGVQSYFDFNFHIYRAEDLSAVLRNSEDTEERLVLGSDFIILSGVGSDSGGRVQYPVNGTPLPAGQSITLYREIAYTQELELVDNDPFSAQLLNEAFDRGVMRDQQLQEQVDRALKYDISTPDAERLTPQEMVQTISNARDEAVSARSGAIEAEGNARGMLVDARVAQNGSEAARDKALLAQLAAEEARDSAVEIAIGDLSSLRSSTPVLSAPAEAFEGTTVSIVITDYLDDGITSYDINTLGFGSASISGNTISWVLGTSAVDVAKAIEVTRRRRGELYSDPAVHQLLVKHVVVQDGPTIAFGDSIESYPGASVNSEGVHTPAYSAPAENAVQIASAKPEIVQTSGKLTLLGGTTESVLKLATLVAAGDIIITDQGECVVQSVSSAGGINIIPAISADVTGTWTASASSDTSGQAYKAFDQDPSTVWLTASGDGVGAWINIKTSGAPYTPSQLVLQARDTAAGRTPIGFDVIARLDGGAWETVLSVSGESVWADGEQRSYDLSVLKTADEWQINNTDDNGSGYTQLASISFITAPIYTATLVQALTGVPTKAIKKTNVAIKVGAGAIGEYIGPKKELTLSSSILSSTTEVNVESAESLKDQILKTGGLHKTLLVDGQLIEIGSVSEVVDSKDESTSIYSTMPNGLTGYGSNTIVSDIRPFNKGVVVVGLKFMHASGYENLNDLRSAIVRSLDGATFEIVARSTATNSTSGSIEQVNFDTPYIIPDDVYTYYPAVVVPNDIKKVSTNVTNRGKTISVMNVGEAAASRSDVNSGEAVAGYVLQIPSFTTTIAPKTELAQIPTSVAIPDRCTLSPASYTCALDGDDLKVTGVEIALEENPALKRLAMAVSGEGVIFKSGKIYIKEKA